MTSAGFRSRIRDGMVVAIGGLGLQRKPMALVRQIAEAGVRDLRVVSYLGSLDVELLIAAGCVGEVHSAGVGLDGFGLAPAFRTARQNTTIRFVEWSEGSLLTALEAAARGLPSLATSTDPRSDILNGHPGLKAGPDPFSGDIVTFAAALAPDLAIIHGSGVDDVGNLYVDGDEGIDGVLARAASHTVATASRKTDGDPRRASIGRLWLDEVTVDGAGAWPTGCIPHDLIDLDCVQRWAAGDGGDPKVLMPA